MHPEKWGSERGNEKTGRGQPDAAVASSNESPFACQFHNFALFIWTGRQI